MNAHLLLCDLILSCRTTSGVQGGFTDSSLTGRPPPAHVKQSQPVTSLHQDKSERPTS